LSLAGELRPVRRLASRVKAARALGFERFVGPRNESIVRNDAGDRDGPETWTAVADLRSSIRIIFGDKKVKAATLDD
jgi:DNA repair protein RadA/Sms